MEDLQKGFVAPLLLAVITVLAIGGGVYIYETKKIETPVRTNLQTEQSNQTNNSYNSSAKISPDLFPVTMNPTDNCSLINNSTFRSLNQQEMGLGPNGVIMGYAGLTLKDGTFGWIHSDVGQTGTYICKNNVLTIELFDRTTTGVYNDARKILTWNGIEYIKDIPIQSSINIIQPLINETWQIGTKHPIQWKLNVEKNELKGSLFLVVFLQDSSGNLINVQAGQDIQKDQKSTTLSIPYFANPPILPGNYHLIFNIYDMIPALPCLGCQGYSKLVASATTTAIITLTASDGKVAPVISSLSATKGRIGDSISISGVAFQNDSKVIFEKVTPRDGQARIKILIIPQIVSSNKLTFTIPKGCSNSDACIPQNSLVTSDMYYVSVQTQYGISNASGIQVIN